MRWKGREQSSNVEDRRGRGGVFRRARGSGTGSIRIPRSGGGGVRRAGGGSIVLFILVALGLWIFAGINPLHLLDMMGGGQGGGTVATAPQQPRSPQRQAADDERAAFISVVLAETEDAWGEIFRASGSRYPEPTLVLFDGGTQSGCGFSSSAVGPFYCPLDKKIYLDLTFFDLLSQRLRAPGDFAQAYVLAHEVGHHVQNLTGVLGAYHEARKGMSERQANAESIKVELQADCYAGVWAHAADRTGIVEDGDIEEAIGAASAVGDDMLQRRSQGYVVPESFNHGTAEERSRWFRVGYRSGNPADCDTSSVR